ncbi:MAG: protein kinase [Planctomycetota bacterium]
MTDLRDDHVPTIPRTDGLTVRARTRRAVPSSRQASAMPATAAPPPRRPTHADQQLPRADDGRYRLGDELGRGGVGRVRAADDTALERELAVKELLDPANQAARREFVDEARLTAQLEHPNIVPVHDLGITPAGTVYLAMKQVRGRTLHQLWQSRERGAGRGASDRPLDAATLQEMLAQFDKVCDPVGFAHSRGVLHCDLKPANIMVGGFGEVLVMDWGLAHRIGDGAPPWAGEIGGTPAFMSPEQANGDAQLLDARSDIFALGGVLYFMLTGRNPYEGADVATVLVQAAMRRLVPPRQRAPQRRIPKGLAAIVMKAMAADPRDRYAKVDALQADLHAWQTHRPIAARRAGVAERVLLWMRRRPTMAASLFLTLMFGLTIASVMAVMQAQVWQEQARVEAQARRAAESARDAADQRERAARSEAQAREARLAVLVREGQIDALRTELGVEAVQRRDSVLDEWNARVQAEQEKGLGMSAYGVSISHVDLQRYLAAFDRLFEAHEKHGVELTTSDYTQRAHLLILLTRYADANRDIEVALSREPDNIVALELKAGVCCFTGEHDRGMKIINDVLAGMAAHDRAAAAWLTYRGQLWLVQARHQEAIADLTRALDANPDYHVARLLRATALLALARKDEALADLDALVEASPKDVAARLMRSSLRRDRRDFAGAIEDATAGAELAPDNGQLWAARGEARRSAGDVANALIDTARAVKLNPDVWWVWAYHGAALASAGRRAEAVAAFDEALRIAGPNADTVTKLRRLHLGE